MQPSTAFNNLLRLEVCATVSSFHGIGGQNLVFVHAKDSHCQLSYVLSPNMDT